MKLFLSLFLVLFFTACDGGATEGAAPQKHSYDGTQSLAIMRADGTRVEFRVDLALTPEQQQRGLMFREVIPDDYGMLFVFPGPETERSFWMKNTLIPLDMLFIRKDGTISTIHENAIPHDLTTKPSNGPVYAGLELKGGTVKKKGFKVGDKVIHPVFE